MSADDTVAVGPPLHPSPGEPGSAREPPLGPGTVLKQYEIIRALGEGGMGMVFLARDTRLGRLSAIKLLLEHSGPAAERFLAEARTTAQCRHDNIVVIYDVDEVGGRPYMALEYIKGRTLQAAMTERGPDPAAAVRLMLPVVRALSCAHAMGIVHRDLKPANVLLSDAGSVKVLDFGIAKRIAPEMALTISAAPAVQPADVGLTQQGALVGTLTYMSPEQWRGEPVDARTDLWAVGLMLFELATGAHPLAPCTQARLRTVSNLGIPMPSARDALPDAGPLADLIDACLAKRKEERIGSAEALALALERLGADKKGGPAAAEGSGNDDNDDKNPFAGLAAFQESDAACFFGRDDEIAAVTEKLRHQQLVAVAGPSGAGKSSFVRAGVLPAVKRASGRLESFVVRPGRRPLAALADVLAFLVDTSGDAASAEADPAAIADTLRKQPGYLGARLRARCRKRGADHRVLLFVDQLEELYTLESDPSERAAFAACIEGVADDASSPLRVLCTIRADFLDRLSEDRWFLAEVTRGLVFLPPMTRAGLRDALQKPLEKARYRFADAGLVDIMLSDLEGMKSPLPILQFTATKLWEARDRERRSLTRDAYRDLGGVAGALSTHADAVLAGLSSSEQRVARSIFLRLVTAEETRAIVPLDELSGLSDDAAAVEQVVQHLADARLLSIDTGGERNGKTVELVHESLIDTWGKLRQWLDENLLDAQFLTQLRHAAQQWDKSGEAEGFLWRDRAALEAGQWLSRRRAGAGAAGTTGLAKREQRYLEAVVALAERARRRQRRIVAALLTGLCLVVLVVSALAVGSSRAAKEARAGKAEAQAQRAEAERSAVSARNTARMAAARERQAEPTTVLALLREIEPGRVPRGWAELALWARGAGVAEVVLLHDDWVMSAAFSPDGRRIASASVDKTVRVWNADGSGQPIVLRGHDNTVRGAAWSPDGQRIVSASWDGTVRLWNADGGGQPVVLRGHDAAVRWAAWSPDGRRIVSVSEDKTVRVWNADGSGQPSVLRGHDAGVNAAAWSPDGRRIVSASDDKTVRVWNADGEGLPIVLRGHDDQVHSAAWSPDGQRIVSASEDKTVRLWNADGSGQPMVLRGHDDGVHAAAWSPDGRHIVSGAMDKTVRLWNADGEGLPRVLQGHTERVFAVAWSPDSQHVVSASMDNTVRVWNADASREPRVLRGHDWPVTTTAWSPDGQRIVSASYDRTVRVWNADGEGLPRVLRGHDNIVRSAAWSPDGRRIVSASQDKTMRVWNADGEGLPSVLRGHDDAVHAAAWSPDGRRIVSASWDGTVRVWNADGEGLPKVLRGHDAGVVAAAWSPDGQRIVSASFDKTVRVWNADGGGQPLVLRGHDATVWSASWSPDGKRIVSASFDKTVRVWNADGGGQPLVLRGHDATVWSASWSPDGKRIVSASDDATVRVWNADGTGAPFALRASNAPVGTAAFSPDGRRIVAGSNDNMVLVWSDLEPLSGADDPRLWTATTYCMPLEVRRRLLDFPEDQARTDLEGCQRRVAAALSAP